MSNENSPVLGPQPSSGILSHLPPMSYGKIAQELNTNESFQLSHEQKVAKAKTRQAAAKVAAQTAAANAASAAAAAPTKPVVKKQQPKKEKEKKEKKLAKKKEEEEESDDNKEPFERTPRQSGFGIVKEVVSGDTIVVVGAAVDGSTLLHERKITLSGIVAPKLGRGRAGGATEEPFAWAAREFLRRKILGLKVYFVVNHKVDDRDFASVYFQATPSSDKEDLAVLLLKAGLASVKTSTSTTAAAATSPTGAPAKGAKGDKGEKKELPKERQELLVHQNEAKAAKLGQWTTDTRVLTSQVRLVNWEPDARPLFEKHRGFPLPAIVDQVRDGSTLRCELLGERGVLSHVMITLYLAGVRSPAVPYSDKKKGDEDAAEPEPLGKEAQQFTEMRLLNREVQVILQGVDTFGNFFGTVRFHRGNISLKLLEKGLARYVAWSGALTGTSEAAAYAAAEAEAKARQEGLWAAYEASEDNEEKAADPTKAITVKVIGVSSGDTITVQDEKGVESRHPLASIRCPRMGIQRLGEPAQAWGWEAREYVRRTLIGRTVQLVEEYTRELRPNEGKRAAKRAPVEVQRHVTVIYNKENISEQLVLRGLATVIHHRPDEPRSFYYDLLLSAEAKAVDAKKGQHGKTPFQRVIDLSGAGDDRKTGNASVYLNELKGQPFEAVVEYVFSPSRLKLYVPHKGIIISFVLGGIQTLPPRSQSNQNKTHEFTESATARTRQLVLQQNVRVNIDDIDKNGTSFIGAIDVGTSSLGATLLQEGWVQVYRNGPADQARASYASSYDKAEAVAQENKAGWWENNAIGETQTGVDGEGKHYTVKVTEIKDAATFYVHIVGDAAVDDVESRVKAFNEDVKDAPAEFKVEIDEIYAARWAAGDDAESYYRVRVEGLPRQAGGKYRVFFIDYGNSDSVELDALRPLPEDLAKLPPIARSCALAGVMAPFQSSEFSEDASYAFNDLAMGKELLAHVEAIKDEQWLVTLNQPSTPVSINAQLVANGWVKLQKHPLRRLNEYVRSMIPYKEEAQKYRRGQFADGANISDDEEDDDFPRRGGGATSGGRRRGVGGGKGSDRPQNVVAPPREAKATSATPAKAAPKAKAAATPAKTAAAAPAKAAAPAAKKAAAKK